MTETPIIEVFSIGTELLMGQIQDTNSHWIAQQIFNIGAQLRRVTMLGDELDEIIEVVDDSVRRGTDIIITTGGLGPTPDDLTVEAMSKLIGVEPVISDETVENFMQRRGIQNRSDINPALLKMATAPATAEVFLNPVGWAPCIHIEKPQVGTPAKATNIFSLPGPPREMQALFERYVLHFISSHYETRAASQRVVVSMYESQVSPFLQEVMQRHPNTYLKAYVALRDEKGMPVDIVATGDDAEKAKQILQTAVNCFAELVKSQGATVEY